MPIQHYFRQLCKYISEITASKAVYNVGVSFPRREVPVKLQTMRDTISVIVILTCLLNRLQYFSDSIFSGHRGGLK